MANRDSKGRFIKGHKSGMTGKKQSLDTIKKITASNKFYFKIHGGAMTGKKHTQVTKDKISKTRKLRGWGAGYGDKNPCWRGGKHLRNGYVFILNIKHPFCNRDGYVMEHRLIMEKHLGRYLMEKEVVHHINRITTDNRIENLMLFPNHSAHITFHHILENHILKR